MPTARDGSSANESTGEIMHGRARGWSRSHSQSAHPLGVVVLQQFKHRRQHLPVNVLDAQTCADHSSPVAPVLSCRHPLSVSMLTHCSDRCICGRHERDCSHEVVRQGASADPGLSASARCGPGLIACLASMISSGTSCEHPQTAYKRQRKHLLSRRQWTAVRQD